MRGANPYLDGDTRTRCLRTRTGVLLNAESHTYSPVHTFRFFRYTTVVTYTLAVACKKWNSSMRMGRYASRAKTSKFVSLSHGRSHWFKSSIAHHPSHDPSVGSLALYVCREGRIYIQDLFSGHGVRAYGCRGRSCVFSPDVRSWLDPQPYMRGGCPGSVLEEAVSDAPNSGLINGSYRRISSVRW